MSLQKYSLHCSSLTKGGAVGQVALRAYMHDDCIAHDRKENILRAGKSGDFLGYTRDSY